MNRDCLDGHPMVPTLSQGSTAADEAFSFTGSLETAQLLSHIESLRSTLRFLRQENAFLKSQDLMRDFNATSVAPPPAKKRTRPSDAERQRSEETRALWKDTLRAASLPKVVDLTGLSGAGKWTSQAKKPEVQYERQLATVSRLSSRFKNLEMPSVVRVT